MRTDFLRPRSAPVGVPPPPRTTPEPAFAARTRLARLRDALVAATARPKAARRWGEPPVFFFDRARQADLEAARPPAPSPAPHPLHERIVAELAELFRSVEVRRVARAVAGLRDAAAALAPHVPAAKDLADLLAVPDDETVLVLHPELRLGCRLLVRGVADANQFQLLLLDAATGDPADGFLPGPPPPSLFAAACRDADPVVPAGVPMVAEARFQLFKPSALRTDGTVPDGFRGCLHWLWGPDALAAVPRVDGERVVLLGERAYPTTWEVERRFPSLSAAATLLDVLSPFQVAERLGRLAGRPVPVRPTPGREMVLAKAA